MILSGTRLSNHVIHVNLYLVMNHVMEEGDHGSLISGSCVLQTKRHDIVHEGSPMCDESSLGFVFFDHLDLIVPENPSMNENTAFVAVLSTRVSM